MSLQIAAPPPPFFDGCDSVTERLQRQRDDLVTRLKLIDEASRPLRHRRKLRKPWTRSASWGRFRGSASWSEHD